MNSNIQIDASPFPRRKEISTSTTKTLTTVTSSITAAAIAAKTSTSGEITELSIIDAQSTKESINPDVFERFFEQDQYALDALEYPRDGDDPGLVLIFNQENFQNSNDAREGSTKDVLDIVTCFGRLGFNINEEHIFKDLGKDELFAKVDEVLKSDLSQINSLLVFLLSHGQDCNIIQTSDETFKLDELLRKFGKCEALRGKPKIFIVQACKGGEFTLNSTEHGDRLIVPLSTFEEVHPDMFIIYSTIEGKCAFRDPKLGTWLIQEICRNATAYGRRDDIMSLSTRVIKCLCANYYLSTPGGIDVQKQIPVVVSTLSKKFYLNRNKDRDLTLRTIAILENLKCFLRDVTVRIGQVVEENSSSSN